MNPQVVLGEEGLTTKLVALPIRRDTCNFELSICKIGRIDICDTGTDKQQLGSKVKTGFTKLNGVRCNFNDRRLTSFKLAITAKHAHKNAIAVCLVRFSVIARPGDCEAPITQCSNARFIVSVNIVSFCAFWTINNPAIIVKLLNKNTVRVVRI